MRFDCQISEYSEGVFNYDDAHTKGLRVILKYGYDFGSPDDGEFLKN